MEQFQEHGSYVVETCEETNNLIQQEAIQHEDSYVEEDNYQNPYQKVKISSVASAISDTELPSGEKVSRESVIETRTKKEIRETKKEIRETIKGQNTEQTLVPKVTNPKPKKIFN